MTNNFLNTLDYDFKAAISHEGLTENDFLDFYKTNVISSFFMSRACYKSMLKTNLPGLPVE